MAISIEAISFESGCVIRHHRYDLELNAFKLGLWPVAEDSREVAGQCTGAGLGAKKPMPQTPMTPEMHSIMPARAWRRHRGKPNNAA